MSLSSEYLEIINKISESFFIPPIKDVIIPLNDERNKNSNFAAIILDDNSVGIFFINLNQNIKDLMQKTNFQVYKGMDPSFLARKFSSNNLFDKCLRLGCINAISQYIFKKNKFHFDYTTDSLGLLDADETDIIGMVGFFPPLVQRIANKANRLIILEKKKELINKNKNWLVTLNPKHLESCNKILITSTTIMNETIDDILFHCTNAQKISIIGPTAGFLPDPLFKRNIDVIGGTNVHDVDLFIKSITNNLKWGKAVKKYTIERKKYKSFEIFS